MVVIVLLVMNFMLIAFFVLRKREPQNDDNSNIVQQNINHLSDNVNKLQEQLKNQLDTKLDKNQESMTRQLASSAKLVKDVTERLTKLDDTNKRVVDVADELKQLQNVLQNPKQRGVLGEFYLEQILQNLLPPSSYSLQYKVETGNVVDAVIHLDGKILPIDSKFSLENYNRLIDSTDAERPDYENPSSKTDPTCSYFRR